VQICSDGVSAGTGFAVRDGAPHTVPNVGRIYGGGSGCNTTTPSGYSSSYRQNFGFDLNPALPDDAGIAELLSPVAFCAGTHDIKVKLMNLGTNTLNSVTVNWKFNGVTQTPINWTTPMPSLSDATLTLGSRTFTAGVPYNLVVWTSNPNNTVDTFPGNDTLTATMQSSLAGNFTIGGASPDYATFSAAVSDLNNYGVCGPVVFDVRSGTYNEQIDLGQIAGTSAINTITFRSETGNKPDVNLTYSSTAYTSNYVVRLSGASFVTFENMTITGTSGSYGVAVELTGNASDNTFSNCELVSPVTTSTSTYLSVVYSPSGTMNHRTSFVDCGIRNGAYGMYLYGGGTTSTEDDVLIQRCEFTGQYYRPYIGYYLGRIKFLDNNVIQTGNIYPYRYPATFYYGHNSEVERNNFFFDGGTFA
jgi:hypothetical protein